MKDQNAIHEEESQDQKWNRGLDLYIATLFHELWHLYQHVHGTLRDKHGKRFWRGVAHSKTNYDDQPWEKEAYRMEKDLVDDYFIYLSDNKLPL